MDKPSIISGRAVTLGQALSKPRRFKRLAAALAARRQGGVRRSGYGQRPLHIG